MTFNLIEEHFPCFSFCCFLTAVYFFYQVVIFKSLSLGTFDKQEKTILPPLISDENGNRRQPGTGFGYAVCGVDLNNDG